MNSFTSTLRVLRTLTRLRRLGSRTTRRVARLTQWLIHRSWRLPEGFGTRGVAHGIPLIRFISKLE